MENYFDKRLDPRLLLDGARSVISLLLNYFPMVKQEDIDQPKISKYAYGKDYHIVVKEKLRELFIFIRQNIGDINGKFFVDSAPVMDKVWAAKSGLGWIGKNANLIRKGEGSFFFISELILDIDLDYDIPAGDFCGNCTACIDACPTDAIIKPYVVDGSKCISYFTIELKNSRADNFAKLLPENQQAWRQSGWAFGCDICQDVCPWNRFSKPHEEPLFNPDSQLLKMTKNNWMDLSEESFKKLFRDSPLNRTKLKGMRRNIEFLK